MGARVEFAFSLKDQAALHARLCRRLYGPLTGPGLMLAMIVSIALLVFASYVVAVLVAPGRPLWVFFPLALILIVVSTRVCRRVNLALARRASRANTLEGAACALEALPDYLLWSGPDWRSEIAWPGVDFIDDGPRAVMVAFRGMGYYAPRSAFTDDAARQAFIAACAEHMTPEARRRSGLA